MKGILKGQCVAMRVINGNELQVAFDMSHDPWKIVGLKILAVLQGELELMEMETEELVQIMKLLAARNGNLQ